jgi:hypothetical protein
MATRGVCNVLRALVLSREVLLDDCAIKIKIPFLPIKVKRGG